MELVQFTKISLCSILFDNSNIEFNTNSSKYQFILKYLFFLVLPCNGYIRQGNKQIELKIVKYFFSISYFEYPQ